MIKEKREAFFQLRFCWEKGFQKYKTLYAMFAPCARNYSIKISEKLVSWLYIKFGSYVYS